VLSGTAFAAGSSVLAAASVPVGDSAGGALPCAASPAAPSPNISANSTVRPVSIVFGFNRKAFFRGSICVDMSPVIDLPSTASERIKIVFRLTVKEVSLPSRPFRRSTCYLVTVRQ
jgi:hypothetical protein